MDFIQDRNLHVHVHNDIHGMTSERRLVDTKETDYDAKLLEIQELLSDFHKKRLFFASATACALLLSSIALITSVFVWSQIAKSRSARQHNFPVKEHFCFQHEYLTLEKDDVDWHENIEGLTRGMMSGDAVICAENAMAKGQLIQRIIKKEITKIKSQPDVDISTPTAESEEVIKPSAIVQPPTTTEAHGRQPLSFKAHLVPACKPQECFIGDMIKWKLGGPNSCKSKDVELEKDKTAIIIPVKGYYFVYSQVYRVQHFNRTDENGRTFVKVNKTKGFLLQHSIYRKNSDYGEGDNVELMLSHQQSKYIGVDQEVMEYTSYVGGVLYLRDNDRIFVNATFKDIIRTSHELPSTFFGVYRV